MTDLDTNRPTVEDLPKPAVKKKRQFSIVWLIPLVAALIGAWLAYKTI
jgi:paraquat-inducible protein B